MRDFIHLNNYRASIFPMPLFFQTFTFALLATVSCSLLQAEPLPQAGYLGVEGGMSDIRHSDFDDDISWRLYGGYAITHYLAVELGYASLGSFDVDYGNAVGVVEVDNVYDISLQLQGKLLEQFDTRVEFQFGVYQADLDAQFFSQAASSGDRGLMTTYRLLQPLGDHFSAVFSWRYYRKIEGVDFNNYQLGLRYSF